MCDYSLYTLHSRLATECEQLVVHRFQTGSVGLASPSDLMTAVCIPPGARLFLRDIPEPLKIQFGLQSEEEVIFEQRSFEARTHRDVVRFANGSQLSLQRLQEGQRVDVISLTSTSPPKSFQQVEKAYEYAI